MFWIREIAGWLLLFLGLFVFLLTYSWAAGGFIFQAWVFLVMGIFIFRGGIHLLKVAIAARICRQAQERRPAAAARALSRPSDRAA